MLDVMIYEVFKEEKDVLQKYLPKTLNVEFSKRTVQEYPDPNPPSKLICVRTQSKLPVSWAGRLTGVLTRSQGYDHLALYRRKTRTKIALGYLGCYCARAVAEHAVMAMMALLKKLKKQEKNFKTFNRHHITGLECYRRKALVIGVGNIGAEIVDILKGLRMDVKGVDLVKRRKDLTYVSLKEGISWAEVVFCALTLTPATKGLLNYSLLKNATRGLIFINVSRGNISPVRDLRKLLDQEILGGLSLDVYEDEPHLSDYLRGHRGKTSVTIEAILNLMKDERVLFTPHNAFNTYQSLDRKAQYSAEAVMSFLENGSFPHTVPV